MNVYRGYVSEVAVRTLRRTVQTQIARLGILATPEATGVETSMMLAETEPVGAFVGVYISEPLLTGGMLVSVFGYMIYLQPLMALLAFIVFSPQLVFVPLDAAGDQPQGRCPHCDAARGRRSVVAPPASARPVDPRPSGSTTFSA